MAIEWQNFETSPPPNSGFFSCDLCVDRLKPFSASLRKDLMPPTHLTSPEKNPMNFQRRFGLIQKLSDSKSPETHSQNCFKIKSASFYGKERQELLQSCEANILTSICFNGGLIAKHKGSIALTVYSTPFARFILKN